MAKKLLQVINCTKKLKEDVVLPHAKRKQHGSGWSSIIIILLHAIYIALQVAEKI